MIAGTPQEFDLLDPSEFVRGTAPNHIAPSSDLEPWYDVSYNRCVLYMAVKYLLLSGESPVA
jgi:hypothetical protein